MAYIYIFTNKINGKKYIGQTIKDNCFIRIDEHKRLSKNKPRQLIDRAIKKYGWDNFKIDYFKCAEEILDNMECALIALYETTNKEKGYNLESGGNKNKHLSKETKNKISEAHLKNPNRYWLGKHPSEETRQKMSDAQKGEKSSWYGRKHTNETKNKMSVKSKCRKHSDETKIKLSIIHTGKKATEETKKKISESHKGEKNSMYGKHHTEETRQKFSDQRKGEKSIWYGKHHTEETKRKMSDAQSGDNNGNAKKIICIETNKIFGCIREASNYYNISYSGISKCCNNKSKTAGNYHWQYYQEAA